MSLLLDYSDRLLKHDASNIQQISPLFAHAAAMTSTERTYTVIFTRHAESESNVPNNSGVHRMDPLLTTRSTQKKLWPAGTETKDPGREVCSDNTKILHKEMFDTPTYGFTRESPVVVSSLSRAIQTALIALPTERLNNVSNKIVISPLIAEQTTWFSDRTRPLSHLKLLVERELAYRRRCGDWFLKKCAWEDFNIQQLLQSPPGDNSEVGVTFGKLATLSCGDIPVDHSRAQAVKDDKPWHIKNGLWAPENLIERGKEAVKMLIEIGRAAHEVASQKNEETPSIMVYGHGGFVNYMTEDTGLKVADLKGQVPKLTTWAHGEHRMFKLIDKDPQQPPVASLLVELPEFCERKENGIPHGQPKAQKDMAIKLQDKIAEIDVQNHKSDLYAKAAAQGMNPPEVVGNNEGYIDCLREDDDWDGNGPYSLEYPVYIETP